MNSEEGCNIWYSLILVVCLQEELIESHKQYIRDNPELKAILADFLQALLVQRPNDVYEFARKYFTPFDPQAPHAQSYPSHKPPVESK